MNVLKLSSFVLLMVTCAASQTELERVRKKIEYLRQERIEAAKARDYDKALEFFTDDVIIMPPSQPVIKGKKELKEMYEQDEKNDVKFHAIGNDISADWLCGDDYYERGSWSMMITSRDIPQPLALLGSYFQIWEKQKDGSYKICYNIWNLNHLPR